VVWGSVSKFDANVLDRLSLEISWRESYSKVIILLCDSFVLSTEEVSGRGASNRIWERPGRSDRVDSLESYCDCPGSCSTEGKTSIGSTFAGATELSSSSTLIIESFGSAREGEFAVVSSTGPRFCAN
jgi:hypothetical protein